MHQTYGSYFEFLMNHMLHCNYVGLCVYNVQNVLGVCSNHIFR